MSSLFAFIHHLAAFVLFAALVVEFLLVREELTLATARRLLRTDMIYGIASMVLLAAGLARVFWFEKGAAYYLHSAPFLAKFALFAAVGLMSIYPTVRILAFRKDVRAGRAPVLEAVALRRMKALIHAELAGVVLIILCAALMARGAGFFG